MMYRMTLITALLAAAPALAEQDYGATQEAPPVYGQQWKDAGSPWKAAGDQFRAIGRSIGNDARQIGPAVRQDFSSPKRWGPAGTRAPDQQYIEVQPPQPYYTEPAYQPQYYETTPSYQPAPYVETVPTYQTVPTYETTPYTGPIYGN